MKIIHSVLYLFCANVANVYSCKIDAKLIKKQDNCMDIKEVDALPVEEVIIELGKLVEKISTEDKMRAAMMIKTSYSHITITTIDRYMGAKVLCVKEKQAKIARRLLVILSICADATELRSTYIDEQFKANGLVC